MEELMKEKFLLQEQLSDEKVRVKNMQMKLTEVESALSDWKQKYSEMQRRVSGIRCLKVEANGFKYLMINLKKWIKNNYFIIAACGFSCLGYLLTVSTVFYCFSENEMIRSDGIACQSRFCYRVVTLARLSYHINYITNPSNNSIYSPMASSISDTIIYSSAV